MRSLKLFNSVPAGPTGSEDFLERTLPSGYLIAPAAAHLADDIIAHYSRAELSGEALNQTFHKSWSTVQSSSRRELLNPQLRHYLTTYGFAAAGIDSDYVYFPDEPAEVLREAGARVTTDAAGVAGAVDLRVENLDKGALIGLLGG